jgi:hypothetical protein
MTVVGRAGEMRSEKVGAGGTGGNWGWDRRRGIEDKDIWQTAGP